MASPVVRVFFTEQIQRLANVPFQETDGTLVVQKDLPELWATVEFDVGSTQRLSVGRTFLEKEYGTGTVIFLIKAGRGPLEVSKIAQAFRLALLAMYQQDVTEDETGITGTVRIENIGPPNGEPYEDGNWLVCSVACVYTYECVRG